MKRKAVLMCAMAEMMMLGARKEMQKTILLMVSIAVAATAFGQTAPSGHRASAKQPAKSQTATAQPAATPVQPAADQGLSLEETTAWIKDKVVLAGTGVKFEHGGSSYTYSTTNFTIKGCRVSWTDIEDEHLPYRDTSGPKAGEVTDIGHQDRATYTLEALEHLTSFNRRYLKCGGECARFFCRAIGYGWKVDSLRCTWAHA